MKWRFDVENADRTGEWIFIAFRIEGDRSIVREGRYKNGRWITSGREVSVRDVWAWAKEIEPPDRDEAPDTDDDALSLV